MKRLICMLLTLVLACSALAAAAADIVTADVMKVTNCKEWVSLRAAPRANGKRLARVPLGAEVTGAEWKKEYGDFIFCTYEGQQGYILSKYLAPAESTAPAASAEPAPSPETTVPPEAGSSPETAIDPESLETIALERLSETGGEPENQRNPALDEEEEKFVSELGFSFYYHPTLVEVDPASSEDGQSLTVAAENEGGAVYLEILTEKHLGKTAVQFLAENAPAGTETQEEETEYGLRMLWFQTPYAENGELTRTYYAVTEGEKGVAAVGMWPAAENAGWLEVFSGLMRSVSLQGKLPVSADWAQETDNALVIDGDGEYVQVTVDQTVTDVALLQVELAMEGDSLFSTRPLYRRDKITPDAPIVIKIAFSGDIPSYGLQFTDESGAVRRFVIALSGRDGDLEMQEF